MTENHFHVYDVVRVANTSRMAKAGEVGRRGVVYGVRRYAGDEYVYSLGSFDEEDSGGLYGHDDLEATGETDRSLGGVVNPYPEDHWYWRRTGDNTLVVGGGFSVVEEHWAGGIAGPDSGSLTVNHDRESEDRVEFSVIVDGSEYCSVGDWFYVNLLCPPGDHEVVVVAEFPTGRVTSDAVKITMEPQGYVVLEFGLRPSGEFFFEPVPADRDADHPLPHLEEVTGGGTREPGAAKISVYSYRALPYDFFEVSVDDMPVGSYGKGASLAVWVPPGVHVVQVVAHLPSGKMEAGPLEVDFGAERCVLIGCLPVANEEADETRPGIILEVEFEESTQ